MTQIYAPDIQTVVGQSLAKVLMLRQSMSQMRDSGESRRGWRTPIYSPNP